MVFDFPGANAYVYYDRWLEKANVACLDEEEVQKLCVLRDIVVEEEALYHQKVAERGEQERLQQNQQQDDNDGSIGLAQTTTTITSLSVMLNRLKALRTALSESKDRGDESNDNRDCTERSCDRERNQINRTNLANQLHEARKRELDVTRRLCHLEATRSNDISSLKVCVSRIAAKLDHIIAHYDRTGV